MGANLTTIACNTCTESLGTPWSRYGSKSMITPLLKVDMGPATKYQSGQPIQLSLSWRMWIYAFCFRFGCEVCPTRARVIAGLWNCGIWRGLTLYAVKTGHKGNWSSIVRYLYIISAKVLLPNLLTGFFLAGQSSSQLSRHRPLWLSSLDRVHKFNTAQAIP